VSLCIVDDYIEFLYIRGLSLTIFINGVVKVLNSTIVSTFTYTFSCKDTLQPLRHCGQYATTYVRVQNKGKRVVLKG
jgi:hypothetical protein